MGFSLIENNSHPLHPHHISTSPTLCTCNPGMLSCHQISSSTTQICRLYPLRWNWSLLLPDLLRSPPPLNELTPVGGFLVPQKQVARLLLQPHSAKLPGVSWAFLSPLCVPTGVEGSKKVLWRLFLFKQGHGSGSNKVLRMETFSPWWLIAFSLGFVYFNYGLPTCFWVKSLRGFCYLLLGLSTLFAGSIVLWWTF